MTTPTETGRVARILVATDASPHGRAALEAAIDLAAALHSELQGLFVEDTNLLRLAALPRAREIIAGLGREQALDAPAMERALRAEANRVRATLAARAAPARINWSFRVVRGRVAGEVSSAARHADLLVLGQASRTRGAAGMTGSTARALAANAPVSVAFIAAGVPLGRPVLVLVDGSAVAFEGLALAAAIARGDGANLLILVAPPRPADSAALEPSIRRWLAERHLEARLLPLPRSDWGGVAQLVRRQGGRLLILPAGHPLAGPDTIDAWFGKLGCPLLVARASPPQTSTTA